MSATKKRRVVFKNYKPSYAYGSSDRIEDEYSDYTEAPQPGMDGARSHNSIALPSMAAKQLVESERSYTRSDEASLAEKAMERVAPDQLDALDPIKLAPRRPAWDLKEELAPVTEQLELATKAAIAELIRERDQQKASYAADRLVQLETEAAAGLRAPSTAAATGGTGAGAGASSSSSSSSSSSASASQAMGGAGAASGASAGGQAPGLDLVTDPFAGGAGSLRELVLGGGDEEGAGMGLGGTGVGFGT